MQALSIHGKNAHLSRLTRSPLRPGAILSRCPTQLRHKSTTSKHHAAQAAQLDAPARTRFAPSPTGFLHLGSLRTALFNYLIAKKSGGQFLLRIEDTDRKRTVPGAEQRLCDDLDWAGIHWDEGPGKPSGCGPFRQSERTALYVEHAQALVKGGHAYRCFCSAERLDQLARQRQALGLPTDYDRQCQGMSEAEAEEREAKGEAHVVRLLAPKVYPEFTDLVYGRVGKDKGGNAGIVFKHGEVAYEDPILLKSDGHPTYHLANVVDDRLMGITHVVRGTEWMSSTPKHLALYEAFGWTPPKFAHVGLLVDKAGRKLSKRDLHTDVMHYKNEGFLPSALVNFVALLGWSHDQESDTMDLQELIDNFRMKFTRGNVVVNLEKLTYLQRFHASRAVAAGDDLTEMTERVLKEVRARIQDVQAPGGRDPHEFIKELIRVDALNYTVPTHFVERNLYFFTEPPKQPFSNDQGALSTERLQAISASVLEKVDFTNADAIESSIKTLAQSSFDGYVEEKVRKEAYKLVCRYFRWALFAGHNGPSLGQAMILLGREVCEGRLEKSKDA